MKEWVSASNVLFSEYINSFSNLSEQFRNNFLIKKEHSFRVAKLSYSIAQQQEFSKEDCYLSYLIGVFHDIGRFRQLIEFNTFDDSKSLNHAQYSIEVLNEEKILDRLNCKKKDIVFTAIENHNKLTIEKGLTANQLRFSKLLRDADKLDILNVLSDYYSSPNKKPNHTLTWELPKNNAVSRDVLRQVTNGELVSKKYVKSETDVKVMQLSWVYDFNFRVSYENLLQNRYIEKVYKSMPKNDSTIEIFRIIKVFVENKILE